MIRAGLDPQGLAKRRDVLGSDYVDAALEWATKIGAQDFQEMVTNHCWRDVWCRDVLNDRDRSLICLGMLIALGRDFELQRHFDAASRNGLSDREIFEVILFSMPYVGIPAALDALKSWGGKIGEKPASGPPSRTRERLAAAVCEITGIDRPVRDEDNLVNDLALNSIDMVEMHALMEQICGREVDNNEMHNAETFGDLLVIIGRVPG